MVFYFLITAVTIALAGVMDAVWTRTGQEAGSAGLCAGQAAESVASGNGRHACALCMFALHPLTPDLRCLIGAKLQGSVQNVLHSCFHHCSLSEVRSHLYYSFSALLFYLLLMIKKFSGFVNRKTKSIGASGG